MEYAKLGSLSLNTFDKNNKEMLEFLKKLIKDETITSRFQGLTDGLLRNPNNEFFRHSFLVTHDNNLIGYVGVGGFNETERCVYLRYAVDKDKRGKSYGKMLLNEVSEYIFRKYPQVESVRLKIADDNKASLNASSYCGFKWIGDDFYAKANPYIKTNFSDIKNQNELMNYMDMNISYGWIDKSGEKHVNTLDGFRESYRTSSIDESLEYKVGTCIEQAAIIKSFFDKIGLENKMYCFRRYETTENFDKEVKMHCFVLFRYQDNWYHFEHSNSDNKGIHKYNSIEDAIKKEIERHEKTDIRELTEIPSIPSGLTFKEFNQYVNNFETIIIAELGIKKL